MAGLHLLTQEIGFFEYFGGNEVEFIPIPNIRVSENLIFGEVPVASLC